MELTNNVYMLTKKLPSSETFALSDQMRRAAVSVPSNIAEWHGRQYDKEFKKFLSIARGSCYEIETQLLICKQQGFFTDKDIAPTLDMLEEIGKMLTAFILHLSKN